MMLKPSSDKIIDVCNIFLELYEKPDFKFIIYYSVMVDF